MTTAGLWGARVVLAWVNLYTAAMPSHLASERRQELLADVHDQVEDAVAARVPSWWLSLSLVGRMLRGAAADVGWRAQVEADRTGRSAALACPGAVLTALGVLSLPWWMAAEVLRETVGPAHVAHAVAWLVVCTMWAVTISYGLVAFVYGAFEHRAR